MADRDCSVEDDTHTDLHEQTKQGKCLRPLLMMTSSLSLAYTNITPLPYMYIIIAPPPATPPEEVPMVVRTRVWRGETDRKLSILVHKMAMLVTHESWRVREAMALWAHCLLHHCHR